MTRFNRILALALLGCCAGGANAQMVGVEGSGNQYPATVVRSFAGRDVRMRLTGAALRSKYFFNVYTIGSYLDENVKARTAEELAAVNAPRQLHLIMERDVDGKDMAEAFQSAIRMNYRAPAFDDELTKLSAYMKANPVKKGDQVFLTYVPNVGLHVNVVGRPEMMIPNVGFARAVWEIYLGPNNLGDAIKKGLTSRL